jgi:hypothetical protein
MGHDEDLMLACAAEALRNMGDPAVLALIEWEIRQSPRMRRLIPGLARRDLWVEQLGPVAAFEDIRRIGTSAVLLLIDALNDEAPDVRSGAALGLGILGDARGVLPLCEVLKDQDGEVRRNAAHALGEIRDAQAVLPLVNALNDEQWPVRAEAALALGNIGDPAAATALSGVLKDPDSDVRRKAAEALNKLGDVRSRFLLKEEAECSREGGRDVLTRSHESEKGLWPVLKGLLNYICRG